MLGFCPNRLAPPHPERCLFCILGYSKHFIFLKKKDHFFVKKKFGLGNFQIVAFTHLLSFASLFNQNCSLFFLIQCFSCQVIDFKFVFSVSKCSSSNSQFSIFRWQCNLAGGYQLAPLPILHHHNHFASNQTDQIHFKICTNTF